MAEPGRRSTTPPPPGSPFATLKLFDFALAQRYGPPRSLADYVEKAQVMNYEATRAQFEAYSRNMDAPNPSTGVIYWMLNNAWPSLHWHLFDFYLAPAGAYFGAKKANESLHIQYSYDDRSIVVVNQTPRAARGLVATTSIYNLDGTRKLRREVSTRVVPANHAARVFAIPQLSGLSRTYFVELALADRAGHMLSRNVYWLSTQPDVLARSRATWYYTPTTRYADFSGLKSLKPATVSLAGLSATSGGQGMTSVRLMNTSTTRTVAFFLTLTLRRGAGGDEVLPVTRSDNDVSLWPGESLTLVAHYRLADLHGAAPTVELSGWNVQRGWMFSTSLKAATVERAHRGARVLLRH